MSGAANPFEAVADAQLTAAAKAQHRAADRRLAKLVVKSEADAPMVANAMEKAVWEKSQLLKGYRKHLAERRATLLAGKYGSEVRDLLLIVDSLTESSAPALMTYMSRVGWFQHCGHGTRLDVLSLISTGIARMRVQHGLSPFEDSCLYEPPTVFEVIRSNMQVLS